MQSIDRRLAREARLMTRQEVFLKAAEGRITWLQAADILGPSPRHIRRMKGHWSLYGKEALVDGRAKRTVRKRLPEKLLREVLRLKRDIYPDFTVRHFHQFITEKHGLKISYTWTKVLLQTA